MLPAVMVKPWAVTAADGAPVTAQVDELKIKPAGRVAEIVQEVICPLMHATLFDTDPPS